MNPIAKQLIGLCQAVLHEDPKLAKDIRKAIDAVETMLKPPKKPKAKKSPVDLVRGILCHHCNVGLGLFRDSIQKLTAAIAYLEQHNKRDAA